MIARRVRERIRRGREDGEGLLVVGVFIPPCMSLTGLLCGGGAGNDSYREYGRGNQYSMKLKLGFGFWVPVLG